MHTTFIMLAAPSMIGKTTVADNLFKEYPAIKVVHNDDLIQNLCDLTRFPFPDVSKEEVWHPLVDAKVDFASLNGMLHRNLILENKDTSVFVAEGYLYMRRWYRDQVKSAFLSLECQVDVHLLKYEPPLEKQVKWQKVAYAAREWHESDEEHKRQLREKWQKFEDPPADDLFFKRVDEVGLSEAIKAISGKQEK